MSASILELAPESKLAAGAPDIKFTFQVEGKKDQSLSLVSPLSRGFLEGNSSNDFLFHLIKPPLLAEGGTRECNLEPGNTATMNKIGVLLLTRREARILPDYSL